MLTAPQPSADDDLAASRDQIVMACDAIEVINALSMLCMRAGGSMRRSALTLARQPGGLACSTN